MKGISQPGHDSSYSTSVTSSSDHAQIARVELDVVLDLAGGNVQLD